MTMLKPFIDLTITQRRIDDHTHALATLQDLARALDAALRREAPAHVVERLLTAMGNSLDAYKDL